MIRPPDDTPPIAANEAALRRAALHGERLVIRADGDERIGMGHVMRCLALAQSWIAAGGIARLACTAVPPAVSERYHDDGVEVVLHDRWPPEELVDGAAAIVMDGLEIPDEDLEHVAAAGRPLAVIDDMGHRARYPGGLVVNQNLHATPDLYAGKSSARLCLGPTYALLRREFRAGALDERPRIDDAVHRILVLMGGADPHGHSALVLDAVARATGSLPGEPEVTLLVGAANPAIAALERRATALHARIEVRRHERDMAGLLRGVDLAVSAAGSTVLEMAALGVPMVIGAQNESEKGPAAALARAGAAIDIGPLAEVDPRAIEDIVADLARDPGRRADMADRARTLVDGAGADRVTAAIVDQLPSQAGIS